MQLLIGHGQVPTIMPEASKIMRQYGEAYTDINILNVIAEDSEMSLDVLLQVADDVNNASTVIKLMSKVVEK